MIKSNLSVPADSIVSSVTLNASHVTSFALTTCKLNLDKDCIAIIRSKNLEPILIKENMIIPKTVIGKEAYVVSTVKSELHPYINLRILHPSTRERCRISFRPNIQFHIKDPFTFLAHCPYVHKIEGGLYTLTDSAQEALEMTYLPLLHSIMSNRSLDKIESAFNIPLFKATCEALNPLGIYVDQVTLHDFCVNSAHPVRRAFYPAVHHHHDVHRAML